jgi:pimeloyl-ACP methyl ester carboxylesterase
MPCTDSGWRVVVPDLRGYGEDQRSEPFSFDRFAFDVAALLDDLDIERVVVGGLSMGGQIVMQFQRLFPNRVRGLILADTSATADSPTVRLTRLAIADRLEREGMHAHANELLPQMVTSTTVLERPDVTRHVLKMMETTSALGSAAALRARADRPDFGAGLAHIQAPTLVIVGRDDRLTPVAAAELLETRISDSSLLIISRAAHMPNLEQAEIFNMAIVSFLDRVRAGVPR